MPENRNSDPVDDAIVGAGNFLIGSLIGLGIGAIAGSIRNNQQQQRLKPQTLRLPHTLEYMGDLPLVRRQPGSRIPDWQVAVGCGVMTVFSCIVSYSIGNFSYGAIQGLIGVLVFGALTFVFTLRAIANSQKPNPSNTVIVGRGNELTVKDNPQKPEPLHFDTAREFTILLPKITKWDAHLACQFVQHLLLNAGKRLGLQIVAEKQRVMWKILDLSDSVDGTMVFQAVRSYYPEAEVDEQPLNLADFSEPFYRYVIHCQQASEFFMPIKTAHDLLNFDPLIPMTQEMSDLREGERVIYTLYIASPAIFAYAQGAQMLTVPAPSNPLEFFERGGAVKAGYKMFAGEPQQAAFQASDQDVFLQKLTSPLYHAFLLVEVNAPTLERIEALYSYTAHVYQFSHERYNAIGARLPVSPDEVLQITSADMAHETMTLGLIDSWLTGKSREWQNCSLIFSPDEIAALWHLPNEQFTAPTIEWLKGKHVAMPLVMRLNEEGVELGENVALGGQRRPVNMLRKDRSTHMIVIGKPNMGKSTLLHNLVRQDIAEGYGVCVIDPSPQGKLVEDILQRSIAEGREDDVFVWDLRDTQYPPSLNFMLSPSQVRREDAAALIMSVFEKVYGEEFGYSRMGHTLMMAMQAIMGEETPTIRDVTKLFIDDEYRAKMTADVESDAAYEFWVQWEKLSSGEQETRADHVIRRLQRLYDNRVLYPIICQPRPLDFGDLIRHRRILLVCLGVPADARLTDSDQSLLGSMMVSQIQLAMTAERFEDPFYVYIDEAQHFVTTALREIFAMARKQNLSLTLANQYLGQLVGDTLKAVEGTIGAMVSFQIGETDVHKLDGMMKPEFSAYDLMNLEVHQAAIRMYFNEKQMRPFTLNTLGDPPRPDEAEQREADLRFRSRQNFTTMSRDDILDWLTNRYPRRKKGKESEQENLSDPI